MTSTNDADLSAQLYASYDGWKGWVAPFVCDAETAAYFASELYGRPVQGARLLEIGFGNGEFLAWAKSVGASVVGSEITPAAISAAEAHGIVLIPANFEANPAQWANQFDIIAAFDVFEHLDPPAIIAKLRAVEIMLKPGGWLLLRFPNGQSPFGLGPQHGDATHVTALSRAKIEQYASGTGLSVIRYGGVARPASGSIAKRMVRTLRYLLRDIHMASLNFLYATDIELEPVVTLIIAKASASDQSAQVKSTSIHNEG